MTQNVVSVRDLCSGSAMALKKLHLKDEDYIIPKYSWKTPKVAEMSEPKLDYIYMFAEKIIPEPGKLTKIHTVKKHD